jgi:hypothetical protein
VILDFADGVFNTSIPLNLKSKASKNGDAHQFGGYSNNKFSSCYANYEENETKAPRNTLKYAL